MTCGPDPGVVAGPRTEVAGELPDRRKLPATRHVSGDPGVETSCYWFGRLS